MALKQPPENWDDIEGVLTRCTCDEYEWEEQSCPYSEDIDGVYDHFCKCCPSCTKSCSDNR